MVYKIINLSKEYCRSQKRTRCKLLQTTNLNVQGKGRIRYHLYWEGFTHVNLHSSYLLFHRKKCRFYRCIFFPVEIILHASKTDFSFQSKYTSRLMLNCITRQLKCIKQNFCKNLDAILVSSSCFVFAPHKQGGRIPVTAGRVLPKGSEKPKEHSRLFCHTQIIPLKHH